MKQTVVFFLSIVFFSACKEETKPAKPILMGDSTTIVTETNDLYLQNLTEDISPTNKKSSEGKIATMMMQVDSAKSVQKLERENNPAPLSGFTINFSECEVVFDGLSAHAIQNTQDERTSNSVSYVKDGGNLNEMTLQVRGLDEVKVEQRTYTKLSVSNASQESFILNDLGKYISNWSTLAGIETKYVSLGMNSLSFFQIDHTKIKNAVDRELRKSKKSRQEIQQWMDLIQKTNSYSDAPCKLELVSAQWRIIGKKNGKRVQKLIQFDIP
ncbi:MAG TPA: hypothetical protein PLU17_09480 [Chitinophagaceae bacterium]|nr:hypothetical protein [Chitinophagaceae bacterium]